MNERLPEDYTGLLHEIKTRIQKAQYDALKAVNKELIALYWDIGRLIVERQSGQTWGQAVVKQLAQDLRVEFPGMAGLSASNLWRIKLFYETYIQSPKLAPMVREIGWTHNLIILEKCKDDLQREFYIRMTRKFGWTKNVLVHHIESQTYEKTLLNQTSFDRAVAAESSAHAKLAVKDEYIFDFLDLQEEHSERELERGLVGRIEHFLREMGGLFTFVGSQYRLEIEGQEFLCAFGKGAQVEKFWGGRRFFAAAARPKGGASHEGIRLGMYSGQKGSYTEIAGRSDGICCARPLH